MTDQPEALRVAHELECRALINEISLDDDFVMELDAARLLREQHAEIERLRAENTMIVLENERLMRQIYDAAIRATGEKP